jgi:hypothetical protein
VEQNHRWALPLVPLFPLANEYTSDPINYWVTVKLQFVARNSENGKSILGGFRLLLPTDVYLKGLSHEIEMC